MYTFVNRFELVVSVGRYLEGRMMIPKIEALIRRDLIWVQAVFEDTGRG